MSALPLYVQVRHVRACLIKAIEETGSGWLVVPGEPNLDPVPVNSAFMAKQRPIPGGYLVIQENGYMRFAMRGEVEDSFHLVDNLSAKRAQLEAQLDEIDKAIEGHGRSAR